MKSKYLIIGGLAFSEESDMEKLKEYATKGWILEGIVGGFFYKLKKEQPQEIVYCLDYQTEANQEYFNIFKEAGWEAVVSIGNQAHIFSAKAGTKPIYSDSETELDKYISMSNTTRKGSIYSLVAAVVLICLLIVSIKVIRPVFLPILVLFVINIFILTFNLLPYIAYKSRIREIKKESKSRVNNINKITKRLYLVAGILWLIYGGILIIEGSYLSALCIIIGISSIWLSSNYNKKYKKF